MTVDTVISTVEEVAGKVLALLEKSANNPPLLGIELISLGAFVKMIPQVDFVIWDFSGQHVKPPNIQAAIASAKATGKPVPDWVTKFEDVFKETFGAVLGESLSPFIGPSGANAITQTVETGKLPNLLQLLGINLPAQITISEILILGGLLLLSEPLLKAIAGSAQGLLSSAAATSALKIG